MKEIGRDGIMQSVRLKLGLKPDLLLFRCQSGTVNMERNPDKPPRWVKYGLHDGASDLIGVKTVIIQPEHVGMKFGLFTAMEIKTLNGSLSKEQIAFLELIEKFGGYSCVVQNVEGAEAHYLAAGGSLTQPGAPDGR